MSVQEVSIGKVNEQNITYWIPFYNVGIVEWDVDGWKSASSFEET